MCNPWINRRIYRAYFGSFRVHHDWISILCLEKTRSSITLVDPFGNDLYIALGLAAWATGVTLLKSHSRGRCPAAYRLASAAEPLR